MLTLIYSKQSVGEAVSIGGEKGGCLCLAIEP